MHSISQKQTHTHENPPLKDQYILASLHRHSVKSKRKQRAPWQLPHLRRPLAHSPRRTQSSERYSFPSFGKAKAEEALRSSHEALTIHKSLTTYLPSSKSNSSSTRACVTSGSDSCNRWKWRPREIALDLKTLLSIQCRCRGDWVRPFYHWHLMSSKQKCSDSNGKIDKEK